MSFEHTEDEIVRRLGVSREALRVLRPHFKENEDWKKERRAVVWSEKGVELMTAYLALNNAKEAGKIMESVFAKPAPVEQKNAVIQRVFLNNQRFMEAVAGELTIIVRVRTNKNFIRGMELPMEQLKNCGGNMWDYVGRLPRGRGIW
jgi:CRISPR/Cas system CMR subunit Cmr4 (Cas7 group RAMP superfamily)